MSDAYDFYPCSVDGKPGAIYVNLTFLDAAPPAAADTRYTLAIRMREPGELGIGTEEEAAAIDAFEAQALPAIDLVFAGRLRHAGIWELTFYGPAGKSLDAVDRGALDGRTVITRVDADPTWSYYRELLLPDAERLRWMDDRRLVQVLAEQGDHPERPRRVDHRVTFASEAARDAFVAAIAGAGFSAVEGTAPMTAQIHRVDAADLEHIHEVVMLVIDAAAPHAGTYDGWIAGIEG